MLNVFPLTRLLQWGRSYAKQPHRFNIIHTYRKLHRASKPDLKTSLNRECGRECVDHSLCQQILHLQVVGDHLWSILPCQPTIPSALIDEICFCYESLRAVCAWISSLY
jgi:hypothetical protein